MRLSALTASTLALVTSSALLVARPASTAPETRATVTAIGGMAAGGCKSVATFTSSALPELLKAGCMTYHAGTNAGATSALDLTTLGKDNVAACAQVLTKVSLANKPQSVIIKVAAGTQTHMGGRVADLQGYTAAMLGWMNNE
jgi:hypothetical protein